ncbi:AP-1 complex-associated regulatory protein-like protein [Amazona aestiva]|uniref:AP-1 complex-associated regulatory protein-like protein n=2 Tax=Amazona TaxID=12929 RepID=A0A0Q3U184_AMAAE|nr:AP-1 complex-associated regulatory protein-like protein [Amazona aestiva]
MESNGRPDEKANGDSNVDGTVAYLTVRRRDPSASFSPASFSVGTEASRSCSANWAAIRMGAPQQLDSNGCSVEKAKRGSNADGTVPKVAVHRRDPAGSFSPASFSVATEANRSCSTNWAAAEWERAAEKLDSNGRSDEKAKRDSNADGTVILSSSDSYMGINVPPMIGHFSAQTHVGPDTINEFGNVQCFVNYIVSGTNNSHPQNNLQISTLACWSLVATLVEKLGGSSQLRRLVRSKYFRTCSTGEHLTIEFENLVESDEGESPGSSHRPLTEEEITHLKDRHYDSIAEKQRVADMKLQAELALEEEKLRLEEEALYAAQREAARAAKQKKLLEQRRQQRITQRAHAINNGDYQSSVAEEDLNSFLRNTKFQYEAFRSSRLSSDATVLTPNTESSCDLMTKTKSVSGNDDSTSLDLEWEDEEGMNRMIPMRERSKTEEDILRAALKFNSKNTGSNPASASDDSNGLEWENDFVSAEMDDNGNSEYAGFVNPVLELSVSDVRTSVSDHQDR